MPHAPVGAATADTTMRAPYGATRFRAWVRPSEPNPYGAETSNANVGPESGTTDEHAAWRSSRPATVRSAEGVVGFGPGSFTVELGPGSDAVGFGPAVADGASLDVPHPLTPTIARNAIVATARTPRPTDANCTPLVCPSVEVVVRIAGGLLGAACVVVVLDAVIRTFVLPRGARVRLMRTVARISRRVFGWFARPNRPYEARDRVLALFAPVTLLAFPVVTLAGVLAGFAGMFAAVTGSGVGESLRWSGSSLFTLGVAAPNGPTATALVFAEAAIGLALLAVLIAYLPSIYAGFSRREVAVTHLSVRAGTPPSAVELLVRAYRAEFVHHLDPLFEQWENWFVDVEESHTTFTSLIFFRSPNPYRSWITAAGALLDTAALTLAVLDQPFSPTAALCLRSGFLSLRAVAGSMGIEYDPDPAPDAPISLTRADFDAAWERLDEAGLVLVADRDAAWRSFAGWRVNYDAVLLEIAARLVAPPAPWSTDLLGR